MEFRRLRQGDIPQVENAWKRAGYSFPFPPMEEMLSSWVAVEDGRIVGWAGAHLVPEITMVLDPDFGSPHWRLGLIKDLHVPVAKDVREAGHEKAYCNVDPKWPFFARHLRKLGWVDAWHQMTMTAKRILGEKSE